MPEYSWIASTLIFINYSLQNLKFTELPHAFTELATPHDLKLNCEKQSWHLIAVAGFLHERMRED